MKYRNDNGEVFEGDTPSEVVRQMSGAKLSKSRSLRSYRRATARRIKDLRDLTVPSTSDNVFLKSLVEHGLLEPID